MFKSIEKKPERTTYDGKDNDEQVLYVIRQSLLVIAPSLLFIVFLAVIPLIGGPFIISLNFGGEKVFHTGFIVIAGLFWYLFVFGYLLEVYANWYFNVFIITNKKIIDMDFVGLLYKNISETTLYNVEDATSNVSGTFGTVFNVGTVFIQTAAEKTEFEFENIDNPSEIRDIISDMVASLKHNHNGNN